MRIGAHLLAGDPAWVAERVGSCYDLVSQIVVSFDGDNRAWGGGELEVPETLRRPDVVAVMARATALVVPSRIEAFGITILEGWRAGVPVVATRHGGPPEFVEDDVTGLLVDPDDCEQLSGALSRLLEHPALAARLGAAGRAEFQGYTWARVVELHEEVYGAVGLELVAT